VAESDRRVQPQWFGRWQCIRVGSPNKQAVSTHACCRPPIMSQVRRNANPHLVGQTLQDVHARSSVLLATQRLKRTRRSY